jgi:hypothetical protein
MKIIPGQTQYTISTTIPCSNLILAQPSPGGKPCPITCNIKTTIVSTCSGCIYQNTPSCTCDYTETIKIEPGLTTLLGSETCNWMPAYPTPTDQDCPPKPAPSPHKTCRTTIGETACQYDENIYTCFDCKIDGTLSSITPWTATGTQKCLFNPIVHKPTWSVHIYSFFFFNPRFKKRTKNMN